MKLLSARIEMYKSIEDSEEFSIDQVTCLVGKNESGKTAILQALQKLNPVAGEDGNFHKTEYPQRFLSTYSDDTNVLTTEWELDQDDVTYMEEKIGVYPFKDKKIVVSKGYDNILWWQYILDEEKIIQSLLAEAGISEDTRTKLQDTKTIEEFEKGINEGTIKKEFIDDTLIDADEVANDKSDAFEKLRDLKLERFPSGIGQGIVDHLSSCLPKMLYFAEYDKLPGKISKNTLIQQNGKPNRSTKANRIFFALLGLANSSIDQIQGINQSKSLSLELESISRTLTDKIFEYWSQNKHLKVEISVEPTLPNDPPPFNAGIVFSTGINNTRDSATINFDEKSSGFIWFFSFLVWLSQVRENYGDNIIVLLDEPGLTLHGTAQKDLLRYINEKLSSQYQVMYTTHSPFMLNRKEIYSIRTVEDIGNRDQRENKSGFGTKVGMETPSSDTLLPLQGIVGFDLAQAMFVGPYILFVEGLSDIGYIKWFSRVLKAKGRSFLDIGWIVCPTAGIDNIETFVKLFKGRVLMIAVLADFHKGQEKKIERLTENGLDKGCLLKTIEFVDQDEADIEDLVGWELIRYVINEKMGIPSANKLPRKKPEGKNKEIRTIKIIDEHMERLPTKLSGYGHSTPVKLLQKININDADSIPGLDEAMDRFEELFLRLNKLINEEEE